MGRRVSKFVLGPAGVCDACGRFCQGLHQFRIVCYHCVRGTFVHRGEWTFTRCPVCLDGEGSWMCSACHRSGIAATSKRTRDLGGGNQGDDAQSP